MTGSAATLPRDADRPAVASVAKCAVPRCPACESERRHLLFEVREHEYTNTTLEAFPLQACEGCGARYLDPRPDVSALDVIYPPNYFAYVLESHARDDVAAAREGLFSRLQNWLYKLRVRPIERHLPLSAETRWLDIGCGDGAILDAMRRAYGMVGTGLDMSEDAIEWCRRNGFEGRVARFEDYEPAPGEGYDLVHSSHVIEHVESPLAFMRKAYQLTRPGGLHVFITPNAATWEARCFGPYWGGLHVPRHWTLLTGASARTLGERAGFEHLETSFSTNSGFWNWTFHAWLVARLDRRLCDGLFPSDHRLIESNAWNLVRSAGLTFLDLATLLATRESSNMLVILRRPARV